MKAIVYDTTRSFAYSEVREPSPGRDEILIRVKVCGLMARTCISTKTSSLHAPR